MPKRTDISTILIIGAGPIVIGQACEFDYSGTQAVKTLKEEGYRIVLVNSNPATIMTDPELADATYIEPITWQVVAKIIEKERPDAVLPTLGGQTSLNTDMDLWKHGVLEKFGVEMIGARADVIDKAEDRQKFKNAMLKIGLDVPTSYVVQTLIQALEIGVETGGSNIQFATHPDTGRMIVIEMNPRVSRSSALASKATGFPIAKIAAKLAIGYTLDEIKNDITRETPASFEPTIDYCVVKVPRFTFEKFPQADPTLTTQMKSVGEAMAIGRTFKEALQKALRSLEIKRFGLIGDGNENEVDAETLRLKLAVPNAERIFYIGQAFENDRSVEEIFELTKIDRWFLRNVQQIVEENSRLRSTGVSPVGPAGVPPVESGRFRGLDRHGEIKITSRNLPHWRQKGAAYFV